MAKYKLNLIDFWRVGELESWYKHMASKGYHFDKAGRLFIKFKKGAPALVDYRIELTPKQQIADEQLHMYEDSGWDYVSSFQYFHVFRAPESRQAPEIHSDPTEQAETYVQFSKVLKRNFFIIALCFLIILSLQIYNIFIDAALFYKLINGDLLSQLMIVIFLLVTIFDSCRSFYKVKKVEKQLKNGIPIKHNVPFKRFNTFTTLFACVLIIVLVGNIVILYKQITVYDRQTLTTQADQLPIVKIEALDNGLKKDSYLIDEVDYGNMIETNWSIFAPKQYEIRESLISNTVTYPESGDPYAPSITSDYYELVSDKLARPFLDSLIEHNRYENSLESYVEYDSPVFDVLIVRDDSNYYKQLFIAKNNIVLKISYHGFATVDELMTEAEKVFN